MSVPFHDDLLRDLAQAATTDDSTQLVLLVEARLQHGNVSPAERRSLLSILANTFSGKDEARAHQCIAQIALDGNEPEAMLLAGRFLLERGQLPPHLEEPLRQLSENASSLDALTRHGIFQLRATQAFRNGDTSLACSLLLDSMPPSYDKTFALGPDLSLAQEMLANPACTNLVREYLEKALEWVERHGPAFSAEEVRRMLR